MSLLAGTVWEIRSTGDDSQGGLFAAGQAGAGTDYSQQDAAQLSLTDVVTNGTTTVTSATGGFTAAMIANGINIAGTCYMIATRSNTNTITVDRTIGAASGQTGKVGGALASPGYCAGQAVTCNNVWIKSGTYVQLTNTINVATGPVQSPGGTAGFPFRWEGYGSTRGDKGTSPLIITLGFRPASGAYWDTVTPTTQYVIFDNIAMQTANTPDIGFYLYNNCSGVRCKVDSGGCGFKASGSNTSLTFCQATGLIGGDAGFDITGPCLLFDCVSDTGSGDGFIMRAGGNTLAHCISQGNAGAGINANGFGVSLLHCDLYNNTGDGVSGLQAAGSALNCIASANGGYGFTSSAANATFLLGNCATYSNTSGATHNLTNTTGMVTLPASPYTAAGTNFGLNNTAGGGAACRAAGLPATFPGLASTLAYPDIGAAQHQDSPSTIGVQTNTIIYSDRFRPTPY